MERKLVKMEENLQIVVQDALPVYGAVGVLFAGVVVFAIVIFTESVFFRDAPTIVTVLAHHQREFFPSGFCEQCRAGGVQPLNARVGDSDLYLIAHTVLIAWLVVSAVWLFILAVDESLLFYRAERLFTASLYVFAALVVGSVAAVVFRFGKSNAGVLALTTLFLLVAHVLCIIAERTLVPFTYPGDAVPLTFGVATSLLSGWLGFCACVSYGCFLSSQNPRPQEITTAARFSVPLAVFVSYTFLVSIGAFFFEEGGASPFSGFWFVFGMFFFVPKRLVLGWGWFVGVALLGVFGGILRVVLERGS